MTNPPVGVSAKGVPLADRPTTVGLALLDLHPPLSHFFRRRLQHDLEHAVVERGLRAVADGSLRQRDGAIEAAIAALAAVPAFALVFVLFLSLALDDHGLVTQFDVYVLFVHAREIGADNQLVAASTDFDLRRPLSALLSAAPREAASESDVLEEAVHLVVPPLEQRTERRVRVAEERKRIASAERR